MEIKTVIRMHPNFNKNKYGSSLRVFDNNEINELLNIGWSISEYFCFFNQNENTITEVFILTYDDEDGDEDKPSGPHVEDQLREIFSGMKN